MKYKIGTREFAAESPYLTLQLRESNDILHDRAALGARLDDNGYLFLREIYERSAVLAARQDILTGLAARGALATDAPLLDGIVAPTYQEPATTSVRGNADLKTDSLKALVYGQRISQLFEQLLGTAVASFQFQWLRAAAPGACSPIHCDAPYMSRGSRRLLTCWTPLGDIPPEMGPLAICQGSHRWRQVVDTYGRTDVDRDLNTGVFSEDPAELVDTFGGRWATTSFQAGDVVIMNMHLLHASLTNTTNRFRLSCDTRFQPADDPMDERWSGGDPRGHDRLWDPEVQLESVEVSRRRWGI